MIHFPEQVKHDEDFLRIVWSPQYLDPIQHAHHSFKREMFRDIGITGPGILYASNPDIVEQLLTELYKPADIPSNVVIRKIKLPDTAEVTILTRAL